MIQLSRQVVLICAFPQPLEALRDELEMAADRGIGVLVKGFRPAEIRGAKLALSTEAYFFLHEFPAQELSVAVDAEQHLFAMLDHEMKNVFQAIWSSSLFLSFAHYNNLYNEWILTRLGGQINEDTSLEILKGTMQRDYPLTQTHGYRQLAASFQRKENE